MGLGTDFAHNFLQNVLDGHEPGGRAKLVKHNGQTALLALETLEQRKQVHAFRDERRKLDGLGQINLRIEEQGARIQDADDGVRRFVIHRQAVMPELTRRGDHLLHGAVVGNHRHL